MNRYTYKNDSRQRQPEWAILLSCVAGALAAGLLSGWLSGALNDGTVMSLPYAAPPVVATYIILPIVYFMAGLSLYFILNSETFASHALSLKKTAIVLWFAQFILALILPFILHRFGLYLPAFITATLTAALATGFAVVSSKVSPIGTAMILPYLAWVIFETYLVLMIAISG